MVPAQDQQLLVLAKVSGAYGVKGWVKLFSYTAPMDNVLRYKQCHLRDKQGRLQSIEITTGKRHGKGLVALLSCCESRNDAEAIVNQELVVSKEELPALQAGEYYWHQLQGLQVWTGEQYGSVLLGEVSHLIETGSNDVVVVEACANSIDDRQRMVPYIPDQFIELIDLEANKMVVDWDPEF